MRRYLIIFLAVLFSIGIYFLTKYILQRLTKTNSVFIASVVSLLGFCVFILLTFLYLEGNAVDPSYLYNPPSIIDGKIRDGNFSN
jgi:Na+-driven multidrug efflux pump